MTSASSALSHAPFPVRQSPTSLQGAVIWVLFLPFHLSSLRLALDYEQSVHSAQTMLQTASCPVLYSMVTMTHKTGRITAYMISSLQLT